MESREITDVLRMAGRRCWLAALASCLAALGPGCRGPVDSRRGEAPVVRGPIPTRIMQPAGLVFPGPRPRRATLLQKGSGRATVDLTYSSIFERNVTPLDAANFDGEIARGTARLQYAPSDDHEIVVEPTFLFASSGFLDSIVDDFHELTGFSTGGRIIYPSDQYSMTLRRDGVVAYELEEDRIMLADLPVSWVTRVRHEDDDGPAIAARLTIELPTGDRDRGSGSGGVDASAGVLLERSLGRWTFFGGLDGVLVDQPRSFQEAGVDVRTLLFTSGGVEYRWSKSVSLLAQAVLQMPLTRSLPFEEIDREILDLGFGVAWDVSPGATLMATFHEDAVAASGPDLTGYLGVSWEF